ncbi:hypothetical protein FOZ60_011052 [Perkinsus olseni]|uniref:Uncharacterized protein n=1 Tax=Perkinsus olseni TaxID=32597 RepID=A0A7J6NF50_PEROL|nr:hypothetical protein FOZ60_011052 [Perkinsus olseni]
MDPFSVAVLNKRNNDTFGSDAESSGRIQRIDDELADRDIESTVASSGDLPESSLEANSVSGGCNERARKRARLAFSGSVARPRNRGISKEMSDLVLKLLAIHGSDIDAIYRAYEAEYRNRKALDSTCDLFHISRELIRKFVIGGTSTKPLRNWMF